MELTPRQALKLALQHHAAGRLVEAEQLYRLILDAVPNEPDVLDMLGAVTSQRGAHAEGLELIDRAIALRPDAADYHANRGLILFKLDRDEESVAALRTALALRPEFPTALYNLANSLQRLKRTDEAMACYQRALALDPNDANIWVNIGNAHLKNEKLEDAIAAYQRAIEIIPDFAEAMSNLGTAMLQARRTDAAVEAFSRASALRPNVPEIASSLAGALKEAGRLDESLAWHRKAVELNPTHTLFSNLVYLLNFHPEFDNRAIGVELARWNQTIAHPLAQNIEPFVNDPSPERRLRIGYVSPNFHMHAEAHFVLPLLESHDHRQFEIHCFASVRKPDEITDRHRRCADVWHDMFEQSDEKLAEQIRAQRIDILVDVTMHMGENRMLAFARKPAPLQVTWLAYPGSTGLETMDYRITDEFIDPPGGDDGAYSEKSIRLPGCWCCYDPLSQADPRPIIQDGPITFGSLNNPCKINPQTLRLWGQIIRQVRDARLLLLCISENQRQQIRQLMNELGISSDRLHFVTSCGREEYLRQFDRIDIALDPLPYNGITTTCDALWMGVPVVTLTGSTAAGRAGASVLTAAGLQRLVTRSPEHFVSQAIALARDPHQLAELRASLRKNMVKSDLMDGPSFARRMENAYQEIWTQWCRQRGR